MFYYFGECRTRKRFPALANLREKGTELDDASSPSNPWLGWRRQKKEGGRMRRVPIGLFREMMLLDPLSLSSLACFADALKEKRQECLPPSLDPLSLVCSALHSLRSTSSSLFEESTKEKKVSGHFGPNPRWNTSSSSFRETGSGFSRGERGGDLCPLISILPLPPPSIERDCKVCL